MVCMKEVKVWTRKTGCMTLDHQCGFWLTMRLFWVNKIDKILHPNKKKNPRSPSMVMTLVFRNGKFLNMTVGNPIPWGCPEGCWIFFLKTKENLNFSLFGAQSRQNLFEVFYRLRQKKNFEKFCPEKKNIDKILRKCWQTQVFLWFDCNLNEWM